MDSGIALWLVRYFLHWWSTCPGSCSSGLSNSSTFLSQTSTITLWWFSSFLPLLMTKDFDWSSASRAPSSLIGSPAITVSPKTNGGMQTSRGHYCSNTSTGCSSTVILLLLLFDWPLLWKLYFIHLVRECCFLIGWRGSASFTPSWDWLGSFLFNQLHCQTSVLWSITWSE